jgi:macrodomain Ter protein organizer (MatP/YcbG family)
MLLNRKLLIVERRVEKWSQEGKGKVKEKSIKVDYESWRILKMESLKRGKPVKKVLREILSEWGSQKEDTT